MRHLCFLVNQTRIHAITKVVKDGKEDEIFRVAVVKDFMFG